MAVPEVRENDPERATVLLELRRASPEGVGTMNVTITAPIPCCGHAPYQYADECHCCGATKYHLQCPVCGFHRQAYCVDRLVKMWQSEVPKGGENA